MYFNNKTKKYIGTPNRIIYTFVYFWHNTITTCKLPGTSIIYHCFVLSKSRLSQKLSQPPQELDFWNVNEWFKEVGHYDQIISHSIDELIVL